MTKPKNPGNDCVLLSRSRETYTGTSNARLNSRLRKKDEHVIVRKIVQNSAKQLFQPVCLVEGLFLKRCCQAT